MCGRPEIFLIGLLIVALFWGAMIYSAAFFGAGVFSMAYAKEINRALKLKSNIKISFFIRRVNSLSQYKSTNNL